MKSNASVLSSVRCILSNGISSPVFENPNVTHDNDEEIVIGSDKNVHYLSAHDGAGDNICRIYFMDKKKADIA